MTVHPLASAPGGFGQGPFPDDGLLVWRQKFTGVNPFEEPGGRLALLVHQQHRRCACWPIDARYLHGTHQCGARTRVNEASRSSQHSPGRAGAARAGNCDGLIAAVALERLLKKNLGKPRCAPSDEPLEFAHGTDANFGPSPKLLQVHDQPGSFPAPGGSGGKVSDA